MLEIVLGSILLICSIVLGASAIYMAYQLMTRREAMWWWLWLAAVCCAGVAWFGIAIATQMVVGRPWLERYSRFVPSWLLYVIAASLTWNAMRRGVMFGLESAQADHEHAAQIYALARSRRQLRRKR